MLESFKNMIGGKFAPLTIKEKEDADMNLVVTTFNTVVTETASEILGKHRQNEKKTKPWVTLKVRQTSQKEGENIDAIYSVSEEWQLCVNSMMLVKKFWHKLLKDTALREYAQKT